MTVGGAVRGVLDALHNLLELGDVLGDALALLEKGRLRRLM